MHKGQIIHKSDNKNTRISKKSLSINTRISY